MTEEVDTEHLDDVRCGAGCTEIWEHMSEVRTDTDDEENEYSVEGTEM